MTAPWQIDAARVAVKSMERTGSLADHLRECDQALNLAADAATRGDLRAALGELDTAWASADHACAPPHVIRTIDLARSDVSGRIDTYRAARVAR